MSFKTRFKQVFYRFWFLLWFFVIATRSHSFQTSEKCLFWILNQSESLTQFNPIIQFQWKLLIFKINIHEIECFWRSSLKIWNFRNKPKTSLQKIAHSSSEVMKRWKIVLVGSRFLSKLYDHQSKQYTLIIFLIARSGL